MKWYTAVGVKKQNTGGRFCVVSNMEERILTEMEIQIWSALLWVFCEETEILERVTRILQIAFGTEEKRKINEAEFHYCLCRLENRGLVIGCEGECAEEAVENLIRYVTMVRTRRSTAEKLYLFKDSLSMGKGVRFALRAFAKEPLSKEEEHLLYMLEQNGRIDIHLQNLAKQAVQAAALVGESAGTFAECVQRDFLADVIALYGRKQLLIESIRKEDFFEETQKRTACEKTAKV